MCKGFLIVPKFIRDGLYNWIAKNRYKWFGEKENKNLVLNILKYIDIVGENNAGNNRLSGQTFVFTGTMDNLERNKAENMVRKLGGNISSSVSKKTNYVVVGQKPGSKYDEALKLGIKILNENDFRAIIGK
jgi:DNA ligase (NAD+)